ncbi:MAG: sugar phosphate isomerase/epimerase [candidate division WOR-3 bacterium]
MIDIKKIKSHLGIQILFDFDNIIDALIFGLDNKLKVIEINLNNLNFSRQLAKYRERIKIANFLKKYKIALQYHAMEGLSFFIPDNSTQKFVVNSLIKTMNYASEISNSRITFHLGTDMSFGMTAKKLRTYEVYPDFYYHLIYDALIALKRNIPANIFLCLENVGGFRYPFVLDIIPKLLGKRFCLTLDIGHINRFTGQEKDREYNFFYNYRRYIKNVHIHDNDGEWDQHNIIGEGNIDFKPYFEFLSNLNPYYIFEVRPKESAIECVKRFEQLFR